MPRQDLSAAEWELMDSIWRAGGQVTVRQVVDTTYPQGQKAYTTVQTIMNILVDKEYLARHKPERINYYEPLVTREEALQGSLSGVARLMFQGSVGAMASFLVGTTMLKPKELDELRQLLDKQDQGE